VTPFLSFVSSERCLGVQATDAFGSAGRAELEVLLPLLPAAWIGKGRFEAIDAASGASAAPR
jgi:hypothetical protein